MTGLLNRKSLLRLTNIAAFFLWTILFQLTAVAAEIDKCVAIYKADNFPESVRCFMLLADQGDPAAHTWVATHFAEGKGLPQNYIEAASWYRKAADKGWAEAQYQLGKLFSKGQGVSQNYSEAAVWFRRASEQGHAAGQSALANLMRDGQGVKQDFAEAAKLYRKASDLGLPEAQNELGLFYLTGNGVRQDYDEAAKLFRQAADRGLPAAHLNMADCHESGKCAPLDYEEVLKWLKKAEAQGIREAKERQAGIEGDVSRLKIPRLKDAEYVDIARTAEGKYKDCVTALTACLEVTMAGRKDPEWLLLTARAYECAGNPREAFYYFSRYDAVMPGQAQIGDKIRALEAQIKPIQPASAENVVKKDSVADPKINELPGNCAAHCTQTLIYCGATDQCRLLHKKCLDDCQNAAPVRNVSSAAPVIISDIRFSTNPDYTRIVISLTDRVEFTRNLMLNPDRLVFDLNNSRIQKELQKTLMVGNDILKSIRSSQFSDSTVRIVLDLMKDADYKVTNEVTPEGITIYLYKTTKAPPRLF